MRLLYVCNDFGIAPNGTKGASIHLRAITAALCKRGHQVWIVSPHEGPGDGHPASRLIESVSGEAKETPRRLKRWLGSRGLDTACALELRPLLYNDWAANQIRETANVPAFDAVIERLASCSTLGRELSERWGVPLVIEANAIISQESAAYRSVHNRELVCEIERQSLKQADAVIAVSATLADRIVDLGVDPRRVHTVVNGVDLEMFQSIGEAKIEAARRTWRLGGRQVVGFAGSLKQWHGVDDLLSAFAQLPQEHANTALLIVGDGPMLEKLKTVSDAMGLKDRVIFTGAVQHQQMPEMLALMDIAVAPFRPMTHFYFSPIKLFEYMAAGAMVVASNAGQIADIIEHRHNGLLFAAGEVGDLAKMIQSGLSSPESRRKMAGNALELVQSRYTWDHAAEKTEKIILNLRGDPPARDSAAAGGVFCEASS